LKFYFFSFLDLAVALYRLTTTSTTWQPASPVLLWVLLAAGL
jgi:hypothetical protein